MKKLAIIGKPNVGKSSFFNRLVRERDAITSEQAGTTRDIKYRVADILDKEVNLMDTGGLDDGNELFDAIKRKSRKAAFEADIILYMVDGKSLPDEDDKKFFYELENMDKTVALVVNKIDNDKMNEKLWEYYEFGTDNIFGISVVHNRSINPLIEWLHSILPEKDLADSAEDKAIEDELAQMEVMHDTAYNDEDENQKEDGFIYHYTEEDYVEEIDETSVYAQNDIMRSFDGEDDDSKFKVAIIGRTNVGKSSLLNALLNEERAVVSSIAGTTIDPINETITYENELHGKKTITFVDTAGLRRRGKIVGIEKYALMRTTKMLDEADIALLVLDASNPFLDLDEKIAGLIDTNRLGCLIVLNKWDIADNKVDEKDEEFEKSAAYKKMVEDLRDRFKFLHYAPIITISAKSHLRVHKIFDKLLQINDNYSQRITTSKLNEVINWAMRKHHLPSMNGQVIRMYYATQYQTRPPRIALMMNKPQGLHFTYRRYLANQLRERFNFEGIPLFFKAKARSNK
jgi:GTP-binding protein